MFEITKFTEARLATLTSRSEKHGDDEVPAVSLGVELRVGNRMLDQIDSDLRQTFYRTPDSKSLPGMDDELTVLRCNSIERVGVPKKYEGWTLEVDDGADQSQPSSFGGCKVDKISFEPMNGGKIVLRLRIGTSDLDKERSGMLGMHVGQPIWITLRAPQVTDEKQTPEGKQPDATDMFVEQHADEGKSAGKSKAPAKSKSKGEHAEASTAGK